MATFAQNIAAIRTAVLGKDVREAIAESLEQTYGQYQSVENFVDQMSVLKYVDVQIRDINNFLWGDVDGDGVVSNTDLTLVARYVSGISIDPRGTGNTAWKTCVNFDATSADITDADRAILAALISQKKYTNDVIARYTFEYEDEHKVYLWGVIPGELVSPTLDTQLSPTSTNAVQNSVIYNAIGNVETLLAAL